MQTFRIGLTLAAVFAARLTLGQEAPPEPSAAPAQDEPSAPAPPAESAPSSPEPAAPSTGEFPTTAPSATSTAAFPTPPPPPPAAPAPAPSPTVATSPVTPAIVAPPPASAQATSDTKPSDQSEAREEKRDDTNGVFGPFRIGPVVGVGLPAFLSFGGAIKLTKYFGAGINYGIVPTLQFAYYGDATVSYQGVGIYGHIHPFGGGFFLGAAIGYAHVRGTYTETYDISTLVPGPIPGVNLDAFSYTSEATMQTLVLTPELGYFYTFESGFSLGIEAGLQIPIAPSEIHFKSAVSENVPQAVIDNFVTPTDERVESTLERVGQTILPTVGIKMGWLF
jgi:hypothetical protein